MTGMKPKLGHLARNALIYMDENFIFAEACLVPQPRLRSPSL